MGTAVGPPVDRETEADTRADGQVEHDRERPGGAEARLGDRRRPHVGLDHHGVRAERIRDVEVAPVERHGALRRAIEADELAQPDADRRVDRRREPLDERSAVGEHRSHRRGPGASASRGAARPCRRGRPPRRRRASCRRRQPRSRRPSYDSNIKHGGGLAAVQAFSATDVLGPASIPRRTVQRHVWGDPLAGEVSDWIYVSSEQIHALVFGLAPHGEFRHSPDHWTVFAAPTSCCTCWRA